MVPGLGATETERLCDFYWSEDQFPVDPETLMRDVADGNHQGFVLFEHGGFSEIAPIDKFFTHQWIIEKRFSGNNLAEAFKKSALPLKDLPGVLELRQACIDLDPGPWSEALIDCASRGHCWPRCRRARRTRSARRVSLRSAPRVDRGPLLLAG